MKVLFVCTGNLCRSPMAEWLLRHELDRRGCTDIEVASAGTWASAGYRATSEAVATLAARGIELSSHRSRPLHASAVADSDLIVAMTSVHVREIVGEWPEAAPKVILLKEVVELQVEPVGGSARDRLAGLLAARRPAPRRSLDVDDPIGLPPSAYERCAGELDAGVRALARMLCEPERS